MPEDLRKQLARLRGKNRLVLEQGTTFGQALGLRLFVRSLGGDIGASRVILDRIEGKVRSEHVSMHGSLKISATAEMESELAGVHERLAQILNVESPKLIECQTPESTE